MAKPANPMTNSHSSGYPNGFVAIASIAPARSGVCCATPSASISPMTPMTM